MLVDGDTIAGWTVEHLLDDGPMSATYKVRQDGDVAVLKVLQHRDPTFAERLTRAAATLIGVDHTNLVRVRGIVDCEGLPGVLADHVEGTDLARWIDRGPHPIGETLRIFHGIVAGLAAAHDAGLVHRNLKPSKVLLHEELGRVVPKLSDFLLGKVQVAEGQALTQMGTTFGTPQYMSPEQFRGASAVDARGDLFSAGCLLYEMCCRERAIEKGDLMGAYQIASTGGYRAPREHRADLPDGVVELITTLLQPDPADRPDDAHAVLRRLEAEDLWSLVAPQSAGRSTIVAFEGFTDEELAEIGAGPEPAPEPEPEPPSSETPKTVEPKRPSQVPTAEAKLARTPVPKGRTLNPTEVFVRDGAVDPQRLFALGGAAAALLLCAGALGYLVGTLT